MDAPIDSTAWLQLHHILERVYILAHINLIPWSQSEPVGLDGFPAIYLFSYKLSVSCRHLCSTYFNSALKHDNTVQHQDLFHASAKDLPCCRSGDTSIVFMDEHMYT